MRISDWSSDVCSSDLVLGSTFGIGERHGENEREQQIGGIHGRASLTMHSCDENPYAFSCASALLRTTSLAGFEATDFFGCLRLQRPHDLRLAVLVDRTHREETAIGMTHDILADVLRSEEHTSELQPLMRISYAVFD